MTKKSLLKQNQGDTLSRLLTQERLKSSGLKSRDASADPDLQMLFDVLKKHSKLKATKAHGLARPTVRKLAGF